MSETEKPKRLEFRIDRIIMDPYYVKTHPFPLKHPNACIINSTGIKEGDYETISAGYWY
ncbi:MAG: hypothetical protein JO327_06350 [Nitrososphaeraceae archaeon]|nr:hypothetical protein [Nitrososphaeraceae archaeon]